VAGHGGGLVEQVPGPFQGRLTGARSSILSGVFTKAPGHSPRGLGACGRRRFLCTGSSRGPRQRPETSEDAVAGHGWGPVQDIPGLFQGGLTSVRSSILSGVLRPPRGLLPFGQSFLLVHSLSQV